MTRWRCHPSQFRSVAGNPIASARSGRAGGTDSETDEPGATPPDARRRRPRGRSRFNVAGNLDPCHRRGILAPCSAASRMPSLCSAASPSLTPPPRGGDRTYRWQGIQRASGSISVDRRWLDTSRAQVRRRATADPISVERDPRIGRFRRTARRFARRQRGRAGGPRIARTDLRQIPRCDLPRLSSPLSSCRCSRRHSRSRRTRRPTASRL